MTREAQIRQSAADWLRYNHPKCTQDMLVEAFRCGAQWADEHPKSPWISVEDKLPDDGVLVIVAYRGRFGEILYASDVFHIDYGWESSYYDKVVAWMPIPELPKEDGV